MPHMHTSVKERLFARYVAEGHTQSDAVRMAGYTGHPAKLGSKLVKRGDVMELIDRRSKELEEERAISLSDHLESLASLRDEAKVAGQYSAAIQAEHHRGKASRLYVDQQHVVEPKVDSPTVILERLNNLLSHDAQD